MLEQSDQKIIRMIEKETEKGNLDNISRTEFYQKYYIRNPEIKWAYLASFVSRNAGWAMTDLKSRPFAVLLDEKLRNDLFMTYERANWLIFSDAFPQLLIYQWSKRQGKPYFHLLPKFGVSNWISEKWLEFWQKKDEERLMIALIVNEQHLIQRPVLDQTFYKKQVFNSAAFKWQDRLHFSTVLFPDKKGRLTGSSVSDFTKTDKRIELGKKLAWILFHSDQKEEMADFHQSIPHTGSRKDYQRFLKRRYPKTPMVRSSYPVITHHRDFKFDWSIHLLKNPDRYLKQLKPVKRFNLTEWYEEKLHQMEVAVRIEEFYKSTMKQKGDSYR
ncbi:MULTISPECIES: DUF2515 family protein [Alteribacter]|uniref:DUF2515 domain-containing protein n=1 Tax=Alteribacter keqinensis TaxID=2483800 RepID=A0A3M7TU67_9BACI|nr:MULTISPECIES: DUF2515 family protein [Alteribacter]MBM7094605.1 DUF2515 family protein [Alteribacter salitolerans]RNA69186.1 DUF2515 domain-containing protein [Alteribacter keqinensis]